MRALYRGICAAEAFVAAALLVFMVALIFLGGVLRMLGHPINWSGDFATAFFAWACFLAADVAWRSNGLMAIEVLTSRLPEDLKTALRLTNLGIIVLFLVYLIVMGIYLSWISRARSFQRIPEISFSWVTMSLPVGSLLLLVTTLLKVRDELHGRHEESRAVDVV